ncbi:MAG: mechanosensitive ion channel [Elusimicrobia bacterium]|nr:mechanosensitive ion channel [Elusimicrobiota bacterium]
MNLDFFRDEYYGNSASAYVLAAAYFLAIVWAFLASRRLAARRAPALASDLLGQVRPLELAVVALDVAARSLELPHRFETTLRAAAVLVVAWRAVGLLSALAAYAIRKTVLTDPADRGSLDAAQAATMAARALIWAGTALFVLSNLGFNVSSMLAGLGIGGVAVALAAQAVLADFFAAIAIHLDKPFVIGDSIQVGDMGGAVERIGVKTTRVRSDNGELLVYPNSMLTTARIQNFRRLRERRAVVTFSVPLDTPGTVLRRIPEQARAIASAQKDVRFERAHLAVLGDSGLKFEFVFFVTDPTYAAFMDRRQAVLIALLDSLQADGISFATPKTTVVLKRADAA